MIIPSIYLPIDIKLFDFHFNIFFLDYTQTKPDFYKLILKRISMETVGFHYEIELQPLKPSIPPKSNRSISEIEALEIGENQIEIKAAALDISDLPWADNTWGWGEAFLWQFYNMVDEKWNVKVLIPGIEGVDGFPLLAARVKFDRDFGIRKVRQRLEEISTDNDEDNGVIDKSKPSPTDSEVEVLSRKIKEYYKLLAQGLPSIETIMEGIPKSTKRGRVTISDDKKLNAIRDWENLEGHSISLKYWLINRFGYEGSQPLVAVSTFHGWRRQLKDKGLLDS
jgi:hypothetical protein